MLILTRRPWRENEDAELCEVVVTTKEGQEILVKVIDATRGQVRLGIQAPSDVVVHRREIANKIARQQEK